MKKNNKGFTLIELLVVIAIMGSILVLAIASLNKISKAKKKESYEKVKNQVEIAAKQYVETNGYLFEDLNPNGSFKTISVGELVEGDYLNTLTNPVTGKKLHKCSNVIVTRKSQNKYTYKFDDTKNICETITTIITESKQNKPKIEITKTSNYDGKLEPLDNWYNNTINYTVKGIDNGGSKIKSVSAYSDSSYTSIIASVTGDTLTFQRSEDTPGTTLYFKAVNEGEVEVTKEDKYKLDMTNPSCLSNGSTTYWVNSDVNLIGTCSDTLSGCRKENAQKTISDSLINNSNIKITTFYDKAGNKVDCTGRAMIDKIKPSVGMSTSGNTDEDREFSLNANDNKNGSGISKTEYKIGSGNWTTYNNRSVKALTSTGSVIVYARTFDNAGNISDIAQSTLICNKDKVEVTPNLNGGSEFYLNFSQQPNWGGNNSKGYEYIVWNKTSTNDDANTANNTMITINGTKYKYSSGKVAENKCGNFASQTVTKVSKTSSKEISILKSKNGNYYAMYYCLAVRPIRDNRNNLTDIGNYFRSTLKQPDSKNINNTGWTIQYKHVYGS